MTIKKILLSLAAFTMISTPIVAEARDRDHWAERHHRDRRGVSTGEALAISLGAVILGSIVSDSRDRRYRDDRYRDDYRYRNEYIPPDHRYDRRYCVREQITEWYRGERYVYWETRCN